MVISEPSFIKAVEDAFVKKAQWLLILADADQSTTIHRFPSVIKLKDVQSHISAFSGGRKKVQPDILVKLPVSKEEKPNIIGTEFEYAVAESLLQFYAAKKRGHYEALSVSKEERKEFQEKAKIVAVAHGTF